MPPFSLPLLSSSSVLPVVWLWVQHWIRGREVEWCEEEGERKPGWLIDSCSHTVSGKVAFYPLDASECCGVNANHACAIHVFGWSPRLKMGRGALSSTGVPVLPWDLSGLLTNQQTWTQSLWEEMDLLKIVTWVKLALLQTLLSSISGASRPLASSFISLKSLTFLSLLKTFLDSWPISLVVWEQDLQFHCSKCLYHLPRTSTSLPSRQMSVFKLSIGPGAYFDHCQMRVVFPLPMQSLCSSRWPQAH